jgi:cell division protein FtsA
VTVSIERQRQEAHQGQLMAKDYKDIVVGLDIGTAKVMAVVAEVMPDGELRVAGLGVATTHGLKRGVVVNIDATVQSIQQALKEAEMMAACKIGSVYTGITGSHIRGVNSTGMVIVRDNREVTPWTWQRVVDTAKAINIPNDQRVLLVEPQEFIIDGHEVKEPIGMSGSRLEVKVHIVTGAQSAAENILKCVRRCGLEVRAPGAEPERQRRWCADGRREGTGRGPGRHRRRHHRRADLHRRQCAPHRGDPDRRRPDHQRHRDGAAHADEGRRGDQGRARGGQAAAGRSCEQVEVPGLGDRAPRMLSRQALAGVIEPRVEEIFSLVHQVIRDSGYEELLSSRHRADRRLCGDAGHGGAGRRHLPQARARACRSTTGRWRHGGQPAIGHGDGTAGRSACWHAAAGLKRRGRPGSVKSILGRAKDWFLGNF